VSATIMKELMHQDLYTYVDQGGTPVYYVRKITGTPEFFMELPTADNKEQRSLNCDQMIASGKLTLFNLKSLYNAKNHGEKEVALVDSEEDVIELMRIGVLAVCLPPCLCEPAQFFHHLKGMRVAISYGSWQSHEYVQRLITLLTPIASDVRILQIPADFKSLKHWVVAKNIGQWGIASYYRAARFFDEIVEQQQLIVSVGKASERLEPVHWLVDEFLEENSLSSLYGPAGSLKSFFAASLSYAVLMLAYLAHPSRP